MTYSRPTQSRGSPRRRAATGSALAAGILVVAIVVAVVFWSELSAFEDELGESEDDDQRDVAVESVVDQPTPTMAAEADSIQSYVEGDVGFPQTLNPLLARSPSEKSVASLLYRSLLFTDEQGDPAPDLATDWAVSPDGRTYSIELAPEARWHDGEPVTVEDVLFTISLVRDADFPGDAHLSRFWRAITATRTGEDTIDFRLIEPFAGFAHYLRLPILPRHHFGGILPADLEDVELDDSLVGSGPYRLTEVNRADSELHLEAVESASQTGLQEVVLRYYQSRDESLEAFRSGELDGVSFVPLATLNSEESLPEGAQVLDPELASYTALFFNVRHPYFRNADTRIAIEHAIDRDAIVKTVLGGRGITGTSPIPRMSSAHEPGEHAPFDPERARALLEQDDWVLEGDDEVRQRDGEYFLIPLIVNSGDPQRMAAANMIRDQLQNVGISVDVQAIATADVQQALNARQFTAVIFGWQSEFGNLNAYQMWHSTEGEDGSNFTGFVDSEADEFLLDARKAAEIEERNQHFAGFQRIFAEQVPAVVLFYPRYHYAVSESVEGAVAAPLVNPADRLRQLPEWSID
ncbi:MAG: peptide ABC transporter substrate-binding protein [Thermomicrobiaceae bacterium]